MALITGRVLYSQDSYADYLPAQIEILHTGQYIEPTIGLANITVTLYSLSVNKQVSVKSSASGDFSITDVPMGSYALVETFNVDTTNVDSVSFNNAIDATIMPVAQDVSISYINSLNLVTHNANRIASLTQNTYFVEVISNVTKDFLFIDAPMKVEPFDIADSVLLEENRVISVDYGTMGENAIGTQAGFAQTVCPFDKYVGGLYKPSDLNSEFYDFYTQYGANLPIDGQFTIVNIANAHNFVDTWFDVASFKKANEEGRFMLINGDYPNTYFFRETITVETDKDYFFSIWVLNIKREKDSALPMFNVVVKTINDDILFNESISDSNPLKVEDVPTWKEIGALIGKDVIGSNTQLIIECVSMGTSTNGNNYCIDEIKFCAIKQREDTPKFLKTQEPQLEANVNDEIMYTIDLNNTTQYALQDIILKDSLQFGTMLFADTLQVTMYDAIDNQILDVSVNISPESLANGIDVSQIIIADLTNIINNSNFIYDQEIVDLLAEGKLPLDYKLYFAYSIKVEDASELAKNCIIYNRAQLLYKIQTSSESEPIDKEIYTNQTELDILCPRIDYTKSVAVIKDGVEVDLANGESILCGERIVYKITISNPQLTSPSNYDLYDKLDDVLIPVYTKTPTCANGISTQVVSPNVGSEVFLSCDEIQNVDGNVNFIKIANLAIPEAEIVDDSVVNGVLIVKIYCDTVC